MVTITPYKISLFPVSCPWRQDDPPISFHGAMTLGQRRGGVRRIHQPEFSDSISRMGGFERNEGRESSVFRSSPESETAWKRLLCAEDRDGEIDSETHSSKVYCLVYCMG